MSNFLSVNPFYQAERIRDFASSNSRSSTTQYAELPIAPRNGSPVPHLTSLYHFKVAGDYGSRSYPGNCPGNIIKDLLLYFSPTSVFDPMTGSGTCRDVCSELEIPCVSTDLKSGFDATDRASYVHLLKSKRFDFIWAHPPYWRQKIYSENPSDMSQAPSLEKFLSSYAIFISECARHLSPLGKLAILMSDYSDRKDGYVPLTYHTKRLAFDCGLRQTCTDIVRFRYNASSSRKSYTSSFIPGLHDMCMVFDRQQVE